jgi:hypothetical protein
MDEYTSTGIDMSRLARLKDGQSLLVADEETRRSIPYFAAVPPDSTAYGLTKEDVWERLDRLSKCCDIVEFRGPRGDERLHDANYCRLDGVCPICAKRTSRVRRGRLTERLQGLLSQVADGDLHAYMATATVRGDPELGRQERHLKESLKRFRKMGQRRPDGRHSGGEWSKVVASAGHVERKRGARSRDWHVHVHYLLVTEQALDFQLYDRKQLPGLYRKYGYGKVPKYELQKVAKRLMPWGTDGAAVPVSKWVEEWHQATGDSTGFHVAPLKRIPSQGSRATKRKCAEMSHADSLAYQCQEIFKYATKLPALDRDGLSDSSVRSDMVEILHKTSGQRTFFTSGELRGLGGGEYDPEDDQDDAPKRQAWWNAAEGTYYHKWNTKALRAEQTDELQACRRAAGKIMGQYRRVRRALLDAGGDKLAQILNETKHAYRERIHDAWRLYTRRQQPMGYGTSNPVVTLTGGFFPNYVSVNDLRDEVWGLPAGAF